MLKIPNVTGNEGEVIDQCSSCYQSVVMRKCPDGLQSCALLRDSDINGKNCPVEFDKHSIVDPATKYGRVWCPLPKGLRCSELNL